MYALRVAQILFPFAGGAPIRAFQIRRNPCDAASINAVTRFATALEDYSHWRRHKNLNAAHIILRTESTIRPRFIPARAEKPDTNDQN